MLLFIDLKTQKKIILFLFFNRRVYISSSAKRLNFKFSTILLFSVYDKYACVDMKTKNSFNFPKSHELSNFCRAHMLSPDIARFTMKMFLKREKNKLILRFSEVYNENC